MATEAELGWAAGMIDGEGCIHIQKDPPRNLEISPRFKLMLLVTNTHRPTLERFKAIFEIEGPYSRGGIYEQKRRDPWKTCYQLIYSKKDCLSILTQLRPYLITKAEQADIVLGFGQLETTYAPMYGTPIDLIEKRQEFVDRLKQAKDTRGTGRGRKRTKPVNEVREAIYQRGYGRGAYGPHKRQADEPNTEKMCGMVNRLLPLRGNETEGGTK